MKRHVAYCSECNASVVIQWDPDEGLDPSKVECLEVVASCQAADCPISDASAEELLEKLEFLPEGARKSGARGLSEAQDLVEKARASSLRRGRPDADD